VIEADRALADRDRLFRLTEQEVRLTGHTRGPLGIGWPERERFVGQHQSFLRLRRHVHHPGAVGVTLVVEPDGALAGFERRIPPPDQESLPQ
jgi:hypothetical protein